MRKQGRADRDVMESAKREPIAKAKSIARVSDIGIQTVRTRPYNDPGRGFTAPVPVSQKTHKGGSQGKH